MASTGLQVVVWPAADFPQGQCKGKGKRWVLTTEDYSTVCTRRQRGRANRDASSAHMAFPATLDARLDYVLCRAAGVGRLGAGRHAGWAVLI